MGTAPVRMHRGSTLRLDLSRSSKHKACAANSPHLTTPRPRGVKMSYSRVSILSRAGEYGLAPFNNQAHGGIARLDTQILHSSHFIPVTSFNFFTYVARRRCHAPVGKRCPFFSFNSCSSRAIFVGAVISLASWYNSTAF